MKAKIQNRNTRGLHDGEHIVMLRRQHPMALAAGLMWPGLLFLVWLLASVFGVPLVSGVLSDPLSPPPEGVEAWLPMVLWLVWVALALGLILWAVYNTLGWFGDWVALTDRRLIIMDEILFLNEKRSEVPLDRIQNVTVEYPNSASSMLDYGNLLLDTAGTGLLTFKNMPHPKTMRDAIFAQQAEADSASKRPAEERRKSAVQSFSRGPGGVNLNPASDPSIPRNITWRKHWIFLVWALALPAVVCLLGLFVWSFVGYVVEQGEPGDLTELTGWLVLFLAFACLTWAVYRWEDWRNDLYQLDNDRVREIEKLPLGLREQSKETLVTRITDVSYVVPGPLANLLDYGNVVIKTPGESTEFVFRGVPNPREVQRLMMSRVEEYRRKAEADRNAEIAAWVRAYHEVQGGEGV
jgi:uncharacterized membrane protein YdbT with pleckstrin-like domain